MPASSVRDLPWARHESRHFARLRYYGSMNEETRLRPIIGKMKAGAFWRVAPPSTGDVPRRLSALQLSADLFRDDTLLRAVILNGLLVLIAGAGVFALLNN